MTIKEFQEWEEMQGKRTPKNKYNNHICEYKGMKFDSEKELNRYIELEMLEKKGIISELERQRKFELQPPFTDKKGFTQRGIYYVCDFFYKQDGKYIIEDVKSSATARNQVYKMKKKMMLYRGWEIKET